MKHATKTRGKTKKDIKTLTVKKDAPPAVKPDITTTAGLMKFALQSNAGLEQMQKLIDMKYREEERQAERDFFRALSDFQASIGTMVKDKEVSFGKTSYRHSSLGQIEKQIKGPLRDAGLSKRFEIQDADQIQVTCIITHLNGHSEKTSMAAGADTSGGKNTIQSRASTVTYLQRYTLIGALGLATADEDNDGRTPRPTTAPQKNQGLEHDTLPDEVLPPEEPSRQAQEMIIKTIWAKLRSLDPKKYVKKYFADAVKFIGDADDIKNLSPRQLTDLTKELESEYKIAKEKTNGTKQS